MKLDAEQIIARVVESYLKKVRAQSIVLLFIAIFSTGIFVLNSYMIDNIAYSTFIYAGLAFTSCFLGFICTLKARPLFTRLYMWTLSLFLLYEIVGILFYLSFLTTLLVVDDGGDFCSKNDFYDCGNYEIIFWLLIFIIFS